MKFIVGDIKEDIDYNRGKESVKGAPSFVEVVNVPIEDYINSKFGLPYIRFALRDCRKEEKNNLKVGDLVVFSHSFIEFCMDHIERLRSCGMVGRQRIFAWDKDIGLTRGSGTGEALFLLNKFVDTCFLVEEIENNEITFVSDPHLEAFGTCAFIQEFITEINRSFRLRIPAVWKNGRKTLDLEATRPSFCSLLYFGILDKN